MIQVSIWTLHINCPVPILIQVRKIFEIHRKDRILTTRAYLHVASVTVSLGSFCSEKHIYSLFAGSAYGKIKRKDIWRHFILIFTWWRRHLFSSTFWPSIWLILIYISSNNEIANILLTSFVFIHQSWIVNVNLGFHKQYIFGAC